MKKEMFAFFAILMVAMSASAQLVDSDFTGTDFLATGQNVDFQDLDGGWVRNNTGHWTYDATNDRIIYEGNSSARAVGQVVSGAAVSDADTLNVYLSMDQGPSDSDGIGLHVSLWGFDGSGAIGGSAGLVRLASWSQDPGHDNTPVPAGYTATAVVDSDSAKVASLDYTTTPLSFTGLDLSAYEYVAVRIGFVSGEADNSTYISKVELISAASAPTEGTVFMLK